MKIDNLLAKCLLNISLDSQKGGLEDYKIVVMNSFYILVPPLFSNNLYYSSFYFFSLVCFTFTLLFTSLGFDAQNF